MVVILIIGILAAIAIPAFLNQRKSAVDSSAESDIRNVATAIETAAVKVKGQVATITVSDADVTLTPATGDPVTEDIKLSKGSTLSIETDKDKINGTVDNAYKVTITNPGGDRASTGISYDSADGGLAN
ncbi:hypothetical protein [Glutamicibacter ardleyensis]|uniref:hypothetical protein n=1 Tax=Glutamicibacter ardleyensis TaxID=225894 RepID=UPI003FD6B166